ncbi:MAG: sigma-54-dependent Fis family transcriptional regulator [Verrucomicrobia bacterium]|nr:sigma-54-dependent Fis family transcriptional regulator [Verrucomicrobiota bacterium]MCH8528148.1 sigma-54 dependent transcriptional regulator [Kiritimatiellia bacterium]
MSPTSSPASRVLIVEDHPGLAELLTEELGEQGCKVRHAPTAEDALPLIKTFRPDLIVSDLRLPGMDGIALLKTVQNTPAPPGFLIITAFGTVNQAVAALKAGADEFLTKPLDLDHFTHVVHRILETRALRREVADLRDPGNRDGFHGMVGAHKSMRTLYQQIERIAPAGGPVLILGESGSGKELVAAALHTLSPRKDKPFLAVNCAGIPETLMESEFFGHVEGAFTGAGAGREGIFQAANEGTLFLDEIAEMPMALQSKLLRVLQEGKIRRVGSNEEETADPRIIAATHSALETAVSEGRFREDLFYRLETYTLRVPPLRERGEDIERLAHRFLSEFNRQMNKSIQGFNSAALDLLRAHSYPGNVRELRNAVERAVTFCDARRIQPAHLPARIRANAPSPAAANAQTAFPIPPIPLAEMESKYIRHVLDHTDGNKKKAADLLGITRKTLYNKIT